MAPALRCGLTLEPATRVQMNEPWCLKMSRDRPWRPDRQAVGQFAGTEESPPHPGREHHVLIPQGLQPSPDLVRPWLQMEALSFTRFISPVPAPCGSMLQFRRKPAV